MKLTGGLILGLAAVGALLAACATQPPPAAVPCRPQKAYQGPPAWEDIVKDAQRLKNLSASVEMTFNQGSPGKLRGLLVYQPPDLLRFEVLSPWGQPSAYLIIKGKQLFYFTFGDNRLILGSAEGPLIKEFLGLDIHPLWLFALLNGRGWMGQGNPQFLGMEKIKENREFYLHYPAEALKESILWEGTAGEVREVVFLSLRDGLEVKAKFEDFLCSSEISFPQKISLSSPSGWQAQMTFNQLQINNVLDPSLFETPTPQEGMKVYYLK